MKQLDRLLFLQGQRCFFCHQPMSPGQASVEHIVALSNEGARDDDNCVVCCKTLNEILGNLSIKEKLQAVLNQRAAFACPGAKTSASALALPSPAKDEPDDRLSRVVQDLIRRGSSRPARVAALTNTISAVFQKQVPEDDIDGLVGQLQLLGYLSIEGDKVTYALPLQPLVQAINTVDQ